MSEECEPFLPVEERSDGSPSSQTSKAIHQSYLKWRTWMVFGIAQVILGIIFTLAISMTINAHSERPSKFRAAISELKLEPTHIIFYNLSQSGFMGEPSPDIDASWDGILAPMNIRVSEVELARENVESVALPEDGGYLAWIGAFHQLHCLNMLRKWIYHDYYHAGLTPAQTTHLQSHVDHCIDFIRQSILCRPDTSLSTFKWDSTKTRPMFNASESEHTCVNWDIFVNSMAARHVPEDEILRLKNPLRPGV